MVGPQGLLSDCQGAPVKSLSLSILALEIIKSGQIVQRGPHRGMVGSQGLLIYCQCPIIKGLSPAILTLGIKRFGQIVSLSVLKQLIQIQSTDMKEAIGVVKGNVKRLKKVEVVLLSREGDPSRSQT